MLIHILRNVVLLNVQRVRKNGEFGVRNTERTDRNKVVQKLREQGDGGL